jgi:hypothetical protein
MLHEHLAKLLGKARTQEELELKLHSLDNALGDISKSYVEALLKEPESTDQIAPGAKYIRDRLIAGF